MLSSGIHLFRVISSLPSSERPKHNMKVNLVHLWPTTYIVCLNFIALFSNTTVPTANFGPVRFLVHFHFCLEVWWRLLRRRPGRGPIHPDFGCLFVCDPKFDWGWLPGAWSTAVRPGAQECSLPCVPPRLPLLTVYTALGMPSAM